MSGWKRLAIGAAILSVAYPFVFLFCIAAFSDINTRYGLTGTLIMAADVPFFIAGSIWLLLQVSNLTAIRLCERYLAFDKQHPVLGRLMTLAIGLAIGAVFWGAVRTVRHLRGI